MNNFKTDSTLSVIVTTYNHDSYIERCLTSILEQTIFDRLQIVWVDDSSTDKTVEKGESVISSYGFKNIDRIHYKTNRFQRGVPKSIETWEAIKGDFIAIIDGDDYLISANKYHRQITLMEQLPNIGISFTRSQGVDKDGNKTTKLWGDLGENIGIVSFGNVIRGDGGLMPTASIVMRKAQIDRAPNWFWKYQPVGDYMYQVLGSHPSGALYIPDITAAYRTLTPNSWSENYQNDRANRKQFHREFIHLLLEMRDSFSKDTFEDFDMILKTHLRLLTKSTSSPEGKVELLCLVLANPTLLDLFIQ